MIVSTWAGDSTVFETKMARSAGLDYEAIEREEYDEVRSFLPKYHAWRHCLVLSGLALLLNNSLHLS